MNWLADLVLLLSAGPLVVMAVSARPTRGENLTAAHRITGPMAIGMAVAWAVHLAVAPLPSTLANVLLATQWPGYVVTMTLLPLAAHSRRALLIKLACALAPAFVLLLGHGPLLHPAAPWVGAAGVASYGLGGTSLLARPLVQRLRGHLRRLLPHRHAPSEFDLRQGAWHREQWQQLPPDARFAVVLTFARSLAPDVEQACHERLAARPDLEAEVAALLLTPEPDDVLHYVVHHYPRSRAPLAAATKAMLATMRGQWLDRLRRDTSPQPWSGNLVPALECGIAVLHDGGDVRAELRALQQDLTQLPAFADLAKQLARLLKKAG